MVSHVVGTEFICIVLQKVSVKRKEKMVAVAATTNEMKLLLLRNNYFLALKIKQQARKYDTDLFFKNNLVIKMSLRKTETVSEMGNFLFPF